MGRAIAKKQGKECISSSKIQRLKKPTTDDLERNFNLSGYESPKTQKYVFYRATRDDGSKEMVQSNWLIFLQCQLGIFWRWIHLELLPSLLMCFLLELSLSKLY